MPSRGSLVRIRCRSTSNGGDCVLLVCMPARVLCAGCSRDSHLSPPCAYATHLIPALICVIDLSSNTTIPTAQSWRPWSRSSRRRSPSSLPKLLVALPA